jgi:hypothetical protein
MDFRLAARGLAGSTAMDFELVLDMTLSGPCSARRRFRIVKLHIVQTGVQSAALEQFLMSTALANCAPFQNSNQVGAANS